MNYAEALSTAACESCGSFQPAHEMYELRFELVCCDCKADYDAKTEQLAVAQFRYDAHHWFKTSHLERLPFNSRSARFY